MTTVTPRVLQAADPHKWREHNFGLPPERWAALADRVYWVVGAGSGFGRAIATALAAAGGSVGLSGRRREVLVSTIEQMGEYGVDASRCLAAPADMRDMASLEQAAASIAERFGGLDALILCAALPQPKPGGRVLIEAMDEADWQGLIDTNVSGAWRACRVAWRHLRARPSPRMVMLTSEAGWADTPGVGAYNISKAALNNLGMSFAAECKAAAPQSDVQLNILIPGEARTEMNQGSSDSPFAACSMTLALLSHPPGGPNGKFFHRDGRHFSFAYAPAYGRPLW